MRSRDPSVAITFLAVELILEVVVATEAGKSVAGCYFPQSLASKVLNARIASSSLFAVHQLY
jgi:hypothetical protein